MNLGMSPTRKFLVLSFVAFATLGLVLNIFINKNIKEYVIDKNKHEISHHIRDHAKEYLGETVFKNPNFQKNKSSFEDFYKAIGYLDSKKIKIYDSDSNILFANEASLIGQNYRDNKELNEALEGRDVAEILNRKKEQDTKDEEVGNLMEIYIPVFYDEKTSPSGVIELYFDISGVYEDIAAIQKNIWFITGSSLFLLYLLLYWTFKKTADLLIEKNRALIEVSKTLKMSEEQDEAMMESMGEGLIVVNNQGQILQYNPKVEEITGYASQDVMFRHYRHFVDIRDKEGAKAKDLVMSALKEGTVVRKTYRENINIRNKEGKLIPVALTIAPIYGKESKIRGMVFTIHDARAEKELDKVKDEFVYVIAHELSNPIFTVSSYLDMVLDGSYGEISASIKTPVTTALSVSKQLSTLVSDLLEVLRSESGQMKFDLAPVNISPIISDIVKDLSIKAKTKKIKLHYVETKLPYVNSNEIKIKEVIINLIDNAIKYSPEGKNVYIKHAVSKDKVITEIQDEGFGMSKSEREHLFEKFYRIRTDETKEISGTGLGLFIVKALIKKMNGDIWVDSEKGKGTTFSFSLKVGNKDKS
ncbi:hypothetical protein COY62_04225 [bacterium (Candidatus Howlettbacteria) CG_4_10_14_0_8_um_filter_40_9]|nr:MAG: hypothetical protein COY62_04225 [bacterium (Candidatus Howlettbacteria) CG_4_10_14_0_8_um_filter_40_9]